MGGSTCPLAGQGIDSPPSAPSTGPGEVGLRKLLPFLPALWRSPVPPPGPSSYPLSHPSPSLAPGPPGGIHTSPLSFCTSHFLLELQAGSLRRLHRNRWPTDLSAAEPNDAVPRAAPTTPRGSCHRPLSHLQLPPAPSGRHTPSPASAAVPGALVAPGALTAV